MHVIRKSLDATRETRRISKSEGATLGPGEALRKAVGLRTCSERALVRLPDAETGSDTKSGPDSDADFDPDPKHGEPLDITKISPDVLSAQNGLV